MNHSLRKLIHKILIESEETFSFNDISNSTLEFGDNFDKFKRRLNPADEPDKSRGGIKNSDMLKSEPSSSYEKKPVSPISPPKSSPPKSSPPKSLDDKTPVMSNPIMSREKKILSVAEEVATKFDLVDIEFLSKSTRPEGASTFYAYSDDHGDIILKLQPIEETNIYDALQKKSINFPKNVMKHFPTIYDVSTLEKLGIDPPHIGSIKKDLGVILMEPLSPLPGNFYDLLSLSGDRATIDKRALYLFSNKESYLKFVDHFLERPQVEFFLDKIERDPLTISRKFEPGPSQNKMPREERADLLKRMLISLFYNRSLRNGLDNRIVDGKSAMMVIKNESIKLIDNWAKSSGILPTITSGLKSAFLMDFENVLHHINFRPIPRDPKNPGTEGPLGKLKGFESFNRAIDYLLDHGIVPGDLHANNLMIRSSTGDIIFSDLGHFKLK